MRAHIALSLAILFHLPLSSFAKTSEPVRVKQQYLKCLELLKSTDPGPSIHHQMFFRADTHLGLVARKDEKSSQYVAVFLVESGAEAGIKRFELPKVKEDPYNLSPKDILDKETVLHFGPSYPPESVTISTGMGNVPSQLDAHIETIDLQEDKPGTPAWILRTFLTDFFKDNAYAWDAEVHEECSNIGDPKIKALMKELEKKKKAS